MIDIILHGDARELLKTLPSESVDCCVTDPPYELGFMGKAWDKSGIGYNVELWKQVLRVLKPGAHLLAFGGSRTYHRMACAIEDAGFEIRDMIEWVYGSGFPKSLDVSKAIDKAAGAKREIIGPSVHHCEGRKATNTLRSMNVLYRGEDDGKYDTAPATDAARQWSGWGTALKPAHEPICMARKPLSEKTVAENVLKHGTGGINIDASRVLTDDSLGGGMVSMGRPKVAEGWDRPWMHDPEVTEKKKGESAEKVKLAESLGRWPANFVHDGSEEVLGLFPNSVSGTSNNKNSIRKNYKSNTYGHDRRYSAPAISGDSGSAARFFYCAKASKSERDEGCEGMEEKDWDFTTMGTQTDKAINARGRNPENQNSSRKNNHPTVKPLALMQYLIKLVCPPGGIVLDPFIGSGTTMRSALALNMHCIGIDLGYEEIQEGRTRNIQVELPLR